jgi:hypothetical protein
MTLIKREEKKRKERKVYIERKEKKRREICICNACQLFCLSFWSFKCHLNTIKNKSHIYNNFRLNIWNVAR